MGNKYLIINADDFGRAKSVNESIFNLLKENRISSATLMPNVNYYEQAVNWSIKNSDNNSLKDSCYFYDKIANKRFGAVNLEGLSIKSTIRVFKPEFKMQNGIIRNFAVEIARLYSNRSFENLKRREGVTDLINYHGVDFMEIPWEEVLKGKDASLIKNKIVFLRRHPLYACKSRNAWSIYTGIHGKYNY